MRVDCADLRKTTEIDLPPHGVLRLHDKGLDWESAEGIASRYSLGSNLRSNLWVDFLADEARGIAVIVPDDSRELYVFNAIDQVLSCVAQVTRGFPSDEGWPTALDYVRFVVAEDEIVVVYELATVCLERNGKLRWKASRPALTHEFSRIQSGAVIFESSDFPPLSYSLVDGRPLP